MVGESAGVVNELAACCGERARTDLAGAGQSTLGMITLMAVIGADGVPGGWH